VLLRGPSGAGKSSLIKALAGLWPHYQTGAVVLRASTVLFVPQDTYCFYGTLLEQVGRGGAEGLDPCGSIQIGNG
jgi:vitamin B12/bleomycin/antimicrobial peptide transport system ATP-binding/permease protein